MSMALEISALHAWYGESHVLHGVDMRVAPGQLVCLLGRNGSGRSSILRALLGLVGRRSGSIRINGRETIAMPTHRTAQLGIGYCPEDRGIFASLSCEENLLLPPLLHGSGRQGLGLEQIYEMFPGLRARRNAPGARLSGGEQQMLAIARILRTGAGLLLLDEVSEGLAPLVVQSLAAAIRSLRELGYTVLLVEQNFYFAASLADHFLVMEDGRIVDEFAAAQLGARRAGLDRLLAL